MHNISSNEIPTNVLRRYDFVIYLGGLTGRVACDQNPERVNQENVDDIVTLADKMTSNQHLIFASTSAVTEGSGNAQVDESWVIKVDLLDRYSKSLADRETALQNRIVGPKRTGLRFGTVVGRSKSQRIDLMHMHMVCSALETGVITVASPNTYRSFLYINDLVRSISAIIQKPSMVPEFVVYHLASFSGSVASTSLEVSSQTGAFTKIQQSEFNPSGFSVSSEMFRNTFDYTFEGTNQMVVQELISHAPDVCLGRDSSVASDSAPCVVCGSDKMHSVLDMGLQPLANDFRNMSDGHNDRHPLHLVRCQKCHHLQLSHLVERSRLFSNYKYVSGTSKTMRSYFGWLARKVVADAHKQDGKVLEIACNDGSQLDEFTLLGWETYGVDPALNIIVTANKTHKMFEGFWGVSRIPELDGMRFDAIVAQNVLAHVPNPVRFMESFKPVMHANTKLYIQTSQCDILSTGQFDTLYHEHISFFTAHSFLELAKLSGFAIVDFQTTPVHGGSCLVTLQISDEPKKENRNGIVRQKLADEIQLGVDEEWLYKKYRLSAFETKRWMNYHLSLYSKAGYQIVGYGAAAKGIVMIHFVGFYNIEFVVDDAPFKRNTFCPGTTIPVRSSEDLRQICDGKSVIVVYAWNFASEIIAKLRSLLPSSCNPIILIPFPNRIIRTLRNSNQIVSSPIIALEWPILLPKREVIMFSHFYNEELLLPFWIRHHAHMFDRVILFDYSSSDRSLEIIKNEAPTSWEVRRSRNSNFDAAKVDEEIMDAEREFPGSFRITLTTTEFLVHKDLRGYLRKEEESCPTALRFSAYNLLGNDSNPLLHDMHLLQQRSAVSPHRFEPASRILHCHEDLAYGVGRHSVNKPIIWSTKGFIIKTAWSPWPEIVQRKTQIGSRIPESDVKLHRGFHHTSWMNKSKLFEDHSASTKASVIDIAEIDLDGEELTVMQVQVKQDWTTLFEIGP